jgi:hypothetical protein
MTDTIDQQIDSLFGILKQKKLEIEKSEKEMKKSWLTNCSYENMKGHIINLQTANISSIQQVATEILILESHQNKASSLLGLEDTPKIQGYSADDWISDCVKRVSVLKIKTQKEQLTQLEKRLEGILSTDQRRQKEFEAIQKALKM